MTREEAYANKLISRSELINKIYDDFLQQLKTKDDEIAELQTKLQSLEVYCEEQKDTWESQENGDHKVYEKILKRINNDKRRSYFISNKLYY